MKTEQIHERPQCKEAMQSQIEGRVPSLFTPKYENNKTIPKLSKNDINNIISKLRNGEMYKNICQEYSISYNTLKEHIKRYYPNLPFKISKRKVVYIKCEQCGKTIRTQSYNRKYCDSCNLKQKHKRDKAWYQKNKDKKYKNVKKWREKNPKYFYSSVKIICKSCGYEERHHGKGLCKRCHTRLWYWEKLENLGITFQKNYLITECIICGKNISMYASNAKYCDKCSKQFSNNKLYNLGTRAFSPYMRRRYNCGKNIVVPDFEKELISIKNEIKSIGIR